MGDRTPPVNDLGPDEGPATEGIRPDKGPDGPAIQGIRPGMDSKGIQPDMPPGVKDLGPKDVFMGTDASHGMRPKG